MADQNEPDEKTLGERAVVAGLVTNDMSTAAGAVGILGILNFLNDPPPNRSGWWASLSNRQRAFIRIFLGLILPPIGFGLMFVGMSVGLIPIDSHQQLSIFAKIVIYAFMFSPAALCSWGLLGAVTGKSWSTNSALERIFAMLFGAALSVAMFLSPIVLYSVPEHLINLYEQFKTASRHRTEQLELSKQMPEKVSSQLELILNTEKDLLRRTGKYGRITALNLEETVCFDRSAVHENFGDFMKHEDFKKKVIFSKGCSVNPDYFFRTIPFDDGQKHEIEIIGENQTGGCNWTLSFDGKNRSLSKECF